MRNHIQLVGYFNADGKTVPPKISIFNSLLQINVLFKAEISGDNVTANFSSLLQQ